MMEPAAMANAIISDIKEIDDPKRANDAFYNALCKYVEANAQVYYAWAATNPTGTPDPMIVITATIKTTGSISPSGATDPDSALSMFSAMLNAQASLWQVVWPAGFALSPAFVMPTINITPSKATDMNSAWNAVCAQIIAGLKTATLGAGGAHGAYTGAATFTSLI